MSGTITELCKSDLLFGSDAVSAISAQVRVVCVNRPSARVEIGVKPENL